MARPSNFIDFETETGQGKRSGEKEGGKPFSGIIQVEMGESTLLGALP